MQLEITRGRAKFKLRRVVGRVYLIGTASDSDLVLGDPQFPEAFAYLIRGSFGVHLGWLGLGPELTVNGQPIETARTLCHQDRLRMGPYEFRVHLTSAQLAA